MLPFLPWYRWDSTKPFRRTVCWPWYSESLSHLSQLMVMCSHLPGIWSRWCSANLCSSLVPETILELSYKFSLPSPEPSLHSLYWSNYGNQPWNLINDVCLPSSTVLGASGDQNRVSSIFVGPSQDPPSNGGTRLVPEEWPVAVYWLESPYWLEPWANPSFLVTVCMPPKTSATGSLKEINFVLPLIGEPQAEHLYSFFLMWMFISVRWYFEETLDFRIILTTFYIIPNQPELTLSKGF